MIGLGDQSLGLGDHQLLGRKGTCWYQSLTDGLDQGAEQGLAASNGSILNPHPPRLNRGDGPSLQACCGLRLRQGPNEDGSYNHHFSFSHESACRARATPAGLPWARPAHPRASRVVTMGALHPGTTASIPTSQGRGAAGRVPDHTTCLVV